MKILTSSPRFEHRVSRRNLRIREACRKRDAGTAHTVDILSPFFCSSSAQALAARIAAGNASSERIVAAAVVMGQFGQMVVVKSPKGATGSNPILSTPQSLSSRTFQRNRSKSARVRAICDQAWTQRTAEASAVGEIPQNLSARHSAGSMEVRPNIAHVELSWRGTRGVIRDAAKATAR